MRVASHDNRPILHWKGKGREGPSKDSTYLRRYLVKNTQRKKKNLPVDHGECDEMMDEGGARGWGRKGGGGVREWCTGGRGGDGSGLGA